MDIALQLFGYLILTFLAIVVPFLIILLSLFQEGVSKLVTQYENEISKSQTNLENQTARQAELKATDVEEIEQSQKKIKESIKELKAIKKSAQAKLSYLNPKRQILRLFILFLISFIGVILAILTKTNIYYVGISIIVSLIFFCSALIVLWRLLGIVVEVRKITDIDKKDSEAKTIELLSKISQKPSAAKIQESYFLKDVFLIISDREIKDDKVEIKMEVDVYTRFDISLVNIETKMAKNVEIGLRIPPDFIVEKKPYYTVFTDSGGGQIVRYFADFIQANTNRIVGPLFITSIKKGKYLIRTFIKGENIEIIYRDIIFIVEPMEPF